MALSMTKNDDRPGTGDVLDVPYLMTLDIPHFRDDEGRLWVDASWAHDLAGHLAYIRKLTLLAPVVPVTTLPDDVVPMPPGVQRIVSARSRYSRTWQLLGLPKLFVLMLREVPRHRIIHTTLASATIPYGWFAIPLARLAGSKSFVAIEATFWRLHPGENAGPWRRFSAWAKERINRWMMRRVDVASYQHEDYRRSLPAARHGHELLSQASWISADDVVSEAAALAKWARAEGRRARFVFATRLVPEKGSVWLADAIALLAERGVDVDIDIIGVGPERERFLAMDGMALGRGRVSVLDPIKWGPEFFAFLSGYDLLLAPSLSDEQPRIIYDAGAQAVGALISDAAGVRSSVAEGESAVVVPRGDTGALADAIAALATDRARLRELGLGAREHALKNTHERMHQDRAQLFQMVFNSPGATVFD